MVKKLGSLLFIFLLASCAGKNGTELSPVLVFDGAAVSESGLTGGIMIYGKNSNNGDHFAKRFDGENITLSNGEWSFTAVGWDGFNGTDTGHPMVGQAKCGHKNASLTGGETSITFSMSTSNCADSRFGPPESKNLSGNFYPNLFLSCSDEEPLMLSDPSMCTGGGGSVGVAKGGSYKVSLRERLPDGARNPGLTSECVNNDAATVAASPRVPLFPPSIKAPVRIKTFDVANCGAGDTKTSDFPNGLLSALPLKLSMALGDVTGGDNTILLNHDTCSFQAGNQTTPHTVDGGNTYVLCKKNQLDFVTSAPGLSYNLERDLDYSTDAAFTDTAVVPATFTGSFNGEGHTISNLSFVSNGVDQTGFFQGIDGGDIDNLKFQNINFDITNSSFHGTLAGVVNDTGTQETLINRVSVDGATFELNGGTLDAGVGGIVGKLATGMTTNGFTEIANSKVKNITFNINSDNTHRLGGVVGDSDDTNVSNLSIRHILADDITINQTITSAPSTSMFGGIFGGKKAPINVDYQFDLYDVRVTNLKFGDSTARLDGTHIGGIAGRFPGSSGVGVITDSKVEGQIFVDNEAPGLYTGGAIGTNINVPVYDLIANVDVDSKGESAGGAFGQVSFNGTNPGDFFIDRVRSLGDVTCQTNCGGMFGIYDAPAVTNFLDFYQSFYTGQVTLLAGGTGSAGGFGGEVLAADANSSLNLFESGTVGASIVANNDNVGGIFGSLGGSATVGLESVLSRTTMSDGGGGPNKVGGIVGDFPSGSLDLWRTVIDSVDNIGSTDHGFISGSSGGTCAFTDSAYNGNLATAGNGGDCNGLTASFNTSDFATVNGAVGSVLSTDRWGDDSSGVINTKFYNKLAEVSLTELGTELDPFILNTPAEWNSIGDDPFFMARSFRLGSDLDFSGGFTPLGSRSSCFHGSLQGNDKTMSNITVSEGGSTAKQPLGIIRHMCAPTEYELRVGDVTNFSVGDYVTNGTNSASGVVKRIDETSNILFVKVGFGTFATGENLDNAYPYGGTAETTISDAPALLHEEQGGSVGNRRGGGNRSSKPLHISNISLEGGPNSETGALVGLASDRAPNMGVQIHRVNVTDATIVNNATTKPSGGIIGSLNISTLASDLFKLSFSGSVVNNANNTAGTGGIVGKVFGSLGSTIPFEQFQNSGNIGVSGTPSTRVGGIIGDLSNTFVELTGARNTGDVTGDQFVGGIVGEMQGGFVKESISRNSTITAQTNYAGGLIGGMNGGTLESSYTESSVDSAADAGGLIGTVTTFTSIARNYTNSPSVTGTGAVTTNYSHYIPGAPGGTNNFFTTQLTGENSSPGAYTEVAENTLLEPATMSPLNNGKFSYIINDKHAPKLWYEVYPEFLEIDQ